MSSIHHIKGPGLFETMDGQKHSLFYRLSVVRTKYGDSASGSAVFETYSPKIAERLTVTNEHGEIFECLVKEISNSSCRIVVDGKIPQS